MSRRGTAVKRRRLAASTLTCGHRKADGYQLSDPAGTWSALRPGPGEMFYSAFEYVTQTLDKLLVNLASDPACHL